MLAISPRLYVGFDTLPQAAEEFAFPAGTAFRLMAAAILAGAGMHVVVLLCTGVVLPWRELPASPPGRPASRYGRVWERRERCSDQYAAASDALRIPGVP